MRLVIIPKPVHKAIHPTSKIPQNEYKYKGIYIFWKYTFNAMELNIVHSTKIKKGNGAFRFDIVLTTLN